MGKVHALESSNEISAEIDLTFKHAVACTGGIGMVQIVPGLTEGRNCQPRNIAGLIPSLKWPGTENMADGVN